MHVHARIFQRSENDPVAHRDPGQIHFPDPRARKLKRFDLMKISPLRICARSSSGFSGRGCAGQRPLPDSQHLKDARAAICFAARAAVEGSNFCESRAFRNERPLPIPPKKISRGAQIRRIAEK